MTADVLAAAVLLSSVCLFGCFVLAKILIGALPK